MRTLRRIYALVFVEHGTRRAHLAGVTAHARLRMDNSGSAQPLMDLGHRAASVKFLIRDRAGQSTSSFDAILPASGTRIIESPVRAPRANSIMERWIGSCRREPVDRTVIWNRRHLMTLLRDYKDFCNTHRPHRILKQAAPLCPLPNGVTDLDCFCILRRDRAGGVIHEYHLVA